MKSIIWAESDTRISFSDFSFIRRLDINTLININYGRKFGEPERDLCEFFTVDKNTMEQRQELFAELLEKPALYERLSKSFLVLENFFEIQKEKETALSNEKLLYSIKELETRVEYLKEIKSIFAEYQVKSQALLVLWEKVKPICTTKEFDTLCEEVDKQIHTITEIKSITVGINLNAQMKPVEAGLISVHEESYVSGEFMDKLMRLNFKNNEFVCAAPLIPLDKSLTAEEASSLRASANSALNKVFASGLKSWSGVVKKYAVNNLNVLSHAIHEWRFVVACMKTLTELNEKGLPLCKPSFEESDKITGLYHPILALNSSDAKGVVKNDLTFDDTASIYVLTGPNQGGKSIYTQSVGILYTMLHLGLPLPAKNADIKAVDGILVHFIDIKDRSYVHGRLSDECEKIQIINKNITENSLFLFDEALSSTNSTEAVVIATEIITAYSDIGARGIWTTHFHELCSLEESYTEGKAKIINLCARIDETSHKRVFKIIRGHYGQSYAMDIAKAYNLTKDEILSSIKK